MSISNSGLASRLPQSLFKINTSKLSLLPYRFLSSKVLVPSKPWNPHTHSPHPCPTPQHPQPTPWLLSALLTLCFPEWQPWWFGINFSHLVKECYLGFFTAPISFTQQDLVSTSTPKKKNRIVYVVCRKMGGTEDHQTAADLQKATSHFFS